jgi:hypothetical protein
MKRAPIAAFSDKTCMELPDRDGMLDAMQLALEAICFKVRYLVDGGSTCVVADEGGLPANAGEVAMVLEAGARLATMAEGLALAEEEASESEEPDKPARPTG